MTAVLVGDGAGEHGWRVVEGGVIRVMLEWIRFGIDVKG